MILPALYTVDVTEEELRRLKLDRRAAIWSSTRVEGRLRVVFRALSAMQWDGEQAPVVTAELQKVGS